MILILDYGSQFTHLIARKLQELQIKTNIINPEYLQTSDLDKSQAIILSGGPASVTQKTNVFNKKLLMSGKPILGLCYGHQLLAHELGGAVAQCNSREYGMTQVNVLNKSDLFEDLSDVETVWMSHGDTVTKLPKGFAVLATSHNGTIAAMANHEHKLFGLQFHPEVYHTVNGMKIFENFLKISKIKIDKKPVNKKEIIIQEIKDKVGSNSVIMGTSGGVDSLVASYLIKEAIQERLYCVYIDNGLMRKNETEYVTTMYKNLGFTNFEVVDASQLFLQKLKNVSDPEEKRKIIGHTFIEVFESTVANLSKKNLHIKFLGQGTIYPDTIESASNSPNATKIKSHHNLTLPDNMQLKLVEPLRYLYKDEVRELGQSLDIPNEYLYRHPFPGPGLAIRILGAIDQEKIEILRDADDIYISTLKESGEYKNIWQAFAALIPIKTVGVMGDARTYQYMIALRAVTSVDGMTADWAKLPSELLEKISASIVNKVKGVNRVVYDITQKPPATIEYE